MRVCMLNMFNSDSWRDSALQSALNKTVQCILDMHSYTSLKSNVSFKGGALVNIYKDGSVLLTHGGTEMGQGLHTKMMQVR